jgi:hypothetical protein
MTGNGKHTTYKNGDLGDGLWHCFNHIIYIICITITNLSIGIKHIYYLYIYITMYQVRQLVTYLLIINILYQPVIS